MSPHKIPINYKEEKGNFTVEKPAQVIKKNLVSQFYIISQEARGTQHLFCGVPAEDAEPVPGHSGTSDKPK